MEGFATKALSVIKRKDRFTRIIQAFNKTPLRYASKFIAITCTPHVYLERTRLAKTVELSEKERSVVASLEKRGYAELAGVINEAQLNLLSDYCLEKMRRAEEIRNKEVLKSKDIWIMLSDEDIAEKNLTSENPLVAFGLQEQVLRIVSCYLKQVPFLEYVALTLSRFAPGPLKSSQLWHFDYDNTSMVKLFVYLTDVNSVASGPFTFIDAEDSKRVKNSFVPRHLPDDEIFKWVPESTIRQMIRPKLSCFMVDTSRCYHMGSRLHKGNERLMYTALYTSLPSNYPWASKEKYEAVGGLSYLQTLALKIKPQNEVH